LTNTGGGGDQKEYKQQNHSARTNARGSVSPGGELKKMVKGKARNHCPSYHNYF
jgi:hypothetical protein